MAAADAAGGIPTKNKAFRVTFPILDADGDLVTGAAALDSEISKDGGTFADATNEATEIATSSGMYFLDLTAAEMNADTVAIIVKTTTTGAKTTPIVLYPAARNIDDLAFPTTTGRSIDVTAMGAVGIDAANVEGGPIAANTTQISGDALAADRLETMLDGTGGNTLSLGQLNIVAGGNDDAIVATGSGTGHGIKAAGGTSGDGMNLRGGATTGSGLDSRSLGGNLHGASLVGNGTGFGLKATLTDLRDATISELAQAAPSATPDVFSLLMFLYMAARNKRRETSSVDEIHNDAGTVIAKATTSEVGGVFTKEEYVSGP